MLLIDFSVKFIDLIDESDLQLFWACYVPHKKDSGLLVELDAW